LPELAPHFANVGRAPWAAAAGLGNTAWRLAASRFSHQSYLPRRFISSGDGGWRMVYHAEQRYDPANRISLASQPDSIGLPKLRIDFRYSERDVDSVVRAHTLLDQDLQAAGAGRLRWREGEGARAAVAASARDGYHQLGGAIMSTSPSSGVVDGNCRAWGLDNLWVASGSVFPSGGQANPTLTIIALACRTADQIASLNRSGIRPAIAIVATRQGGRRSARRPAAV
jgi:hypothetical protein